MLQWRSRTYLRKKGKLTDNEYKEIQMQQNKPFGEMTHIDYMNAVWKAPIKSQAKYLLSYYATRYNFTTRANCYATTETIAREMGWSKTTVTEWKKYLKEFGWIKSLHRANTSDYVNVRLGDADPSVKVIEVSDDTLSHEDAKYDTEYRKD
jgi:hypothetical protein